MRVGAREGSAYRSVKLVSLDNGNRCEVDSNTFISGKAFYIHSKYCPVPILWPFFLAHFRICSLCCIRASVSACRCFKPSLRTSEAVAAQAHTGAPHVLGIATFQWVPHDLCLQFFSPFVRGACCCILWCHFPSCSCCFRERKKIAENIKGLADSTRRGMMKLMRWGIEWSWCCVRRGRTHICLI